MTRVVSLPPVQVASGNPNHGKLNGTAALATIPAVILIVAAAPTVSAQAGAGSWKVAGPEFEWSFPRDHWAHAGYKTEWWYFTGQLTGVTDSTIRFGYQFTFFRVGLVPDSLAINSAWAVTDLVMGHAALTNLSTGEHRFSELVYRANGFLGAFPPAGDSLVVWSRAPTGTDGTWELRWNGAGFAFAATDERAAMSMNLVTRENKQLLFQGPNGYSRKGEGPTAASLYYSLPRLVTQGTISFDGRELAVTGESWMDKEFGSNQLGEGQMGWDWFSLRLDDGTDLMLYLLRDGFGNVDYARATLNSPQGAPRYLDGNEFRVEALAAWQSGETDAEYPVAWLIAIPTEGLTLYVKAEKPNQENVSRLVPNLFYWEGSVLVGDVNGNRLGEGYAELTGYGAAVPLGI